MVTAEQIDSMTDEQIDVLYRQFIAQESVSKPKTLVEFVQETTKHTLDPWQVDLCKVLESLKDTTGRRILIAAPPQMGKSIIVSQRFPAWLIGQKPDHRVKLACYNITHASRFGRIVRDMMQSEEYAGMFPDEGLRLPKIAATEEWSTQARLAKRDGQPSFKALGLATGFVGQGADCFTAETLVKTEAGDVPIGHLYQQKKHPKVYAFDHETGQVVLRRIEAMREIDAYELVEITTHAGRKFRCTPDHRIFVPGIGYTPAASLTSGTPLNVCDADVRVLPEAVLPSQVGPSEVARKRLQGHLLFAALFAFTSRSQKCRYLQALRKAQTGPTTFVVLFRRMQGRIVAGLARNISRQSERLRVLWRGIQADLGTYSVLLSELCGYGALAAHARQGELALQGRDQLRQVVRGNAAASFRARQSSVFSLPDSREAVHGDLARAGDNADELARTPYQSQPERQHASEPNNALQEVSLQTPQVADDSVAVVRRLRSRRVSVYDLQVEGCRNFFADGVLVHNCLIVDDPYASPQDAYSPIINGKTHAFWSDTAKPRLNDDTNVVVMFHRYTETDLAGWLMEQEPDEWELIRYAAIADGDYVHPSTGKAYPDPLEREEGDKLSPRFSDGWYETQQENSFVWLSQFQGRPTAREGGMFKLHHLPIVEAAPAGPSIKRIRYWDLGGSDSKTADYTVGCLMSKTPDNLFYVEDIKRGQWSPKERNEQIRTTAEADRVAFGSDVSTWIEKVPGLAVEVIENLVRYLAGYTVHTEMAKNDKVTRADPLASQCEANNVKVVAGPWNAAFRNEMTSFPNGKNDDQVDGASGAFSKLARNREVRIF